MERLPTPADERPHESDALPDAPYTATATVSEQGIVTQWSEGARRLLGYPPAEIVGQPAARLLADPTTFAPAAGAGTADTAGTAGTAGGGGGGAGRRDAAGRQRWSGTLALRHRDGHLLVQALLAHRRTPDGADAEWLVVSAAAATTHPPGSQALGEWAFRQSPGILAVFGPDLRLVRASAGLEHTLALTEEQMRGLRLPEIAPHPANEQAQQQIRRTLKTGEPQHTDVCLPPQDPGPQHDWPASLTPLKNPAGQVRAVCLTAHHSLREHLARQRMLLLSDAGTRIGTTPDATRTAQELADTAVPRLADFTAVELLDTPRPDPAHPTPAHPSPAQPGPAQPGPVQSGPAQPGPAQPGPVRYGAAAPAEAPAQPLILRRTAVRPAAPGPAPPAPADNTTAYPALSPVAECLAKGHGTLYRANDPALARWAAKDPQAAWIRTPGTHSVMVVPIRAHNTTLGVALFSRHQRPEPFEADDLWLAEELTAKAALSIHHTRQHTRRHTTTMTLQRSLLPQTLPDQKALDIATRYLPAATQAGIGGDWFDVIPLSGARVALVVGDVVGHGIRASATMGRLRTAVRTLADVDLPPDELLTHLDDLVLHLSADESGTNAATENAAGIGTTCLYAVYDPISRHCTLARAGHPPPATVTPDGTVRFLDIPPGPPLGLGGLPFETTETQLPEGSILALYTNGHLATRDHDIDEALDTMFTTLARPAPTLDTLRDRILTTMLTHHPDDDTALLIARTHALHTDHVATWNLPPDPTIVAQARQNATNQLTTWHLDDAAYTTQLTVSELLTNATRYGQPPIQLRPIHQQTTLTTEVTDSSNTTPHMRRTHTYDEGGRGLLLIAQLTHRWGTRHTPTGKTVWTEQTLPPQPPTHPPPKTRDTDACSPTADDQQPSNVPPHHDHAESYTRANRSTSDRRSTRSICAPP